ncbi:MAG: DUF3320 domain-containing protein [Candidatus Azobacteroides sp.]|nr:DUF3320 domain-containing protein [Candidatus Azobacteroides sp.]
MNTKQHSPYIKVEFTYLPVVNFAMQQNKVFLIRKFSIQNISEEILEDITIKLSAEPEFAIVFPYSIDILPVGEALLIDSLRINLSTDFFIQLTERINGHFLLEIFSGEVSLFRQIYPIAMLAFDQWGGIAILPEMLSSFVIPNHPAIVPILKRASEIIEKWTGNPSFDEYQSRNPDRVKKQIAALYAAISEENITYSSVPASFEEHGQRIRLTDVVTEQKMGNCLDMSVLYTACMEAIGIHPLIIVTQGHAFAGGWLIPETFPDSITDDVSFLTKRIAKGINEIVVVESTCMNQGQETDFDQAIRNAERKLLNPTDFVLALDIKRSRFSGIRPLPQRIADNTRWTIKEEEIFTESSPANPESINPYDLSGISREIKVTKQLLWERKLLDLSLRNNLLNIRVTKNTLQLISIDLDHFEDALADGEEFRIMAKPADWSSPLFNFGLYHSLEPSDPVIELIRSELTQKRLRSYLTELELQKALQHLYRSSRLSIEENGANTLYLALGLLQWYETPASERPRYAPILLLPVEIIRKSAAKGYVIRSREEEAMMNITLLEMLRQNFGITIPGLDPLPTDESGVNVRLIYSLIRDSIKEQRKWDVEEQAILGIFSFNKFIMWNDIHHNSHKLMENKIVSSLVNGKIEWEIKEEIADASVLDKQLSPADIVLPINADSSQLEAIYEAVNDTTFILHGPPGTGKSQTITNIIANALYKGKRVLFVAEKMAALSVVQHRLETIGLSPFCLEVHSNKTKKSAVLGQLKETSEVVRVTSPEDFALQAERIHKLRIELNTYIHSLHKKYSFGLSLYEAITRYLSTESPCSFPFPLSLLEGLSKEKVLAWQDMIETMVSTGKACGHPYHHPLADIEITAFSATLKEEISSLFKETRNILLTLSAQLPLLSGILGENKDGYDKEQTNILSGLIRQLLETPELTPQLLTTPRLNETLEEYKGIISHGKAKAAFRRDLLSSFSEGIFALPAGELLSEWNQYAGKWLLPRFLGWKKIKKQLLLHSRNKKIENAAVPDILALLINYQAEEKFLGKYIRSIPLFFGKYGNPDEEDWDKISLIISYTQVINHYILQCTGDIEAAGKAKSILAGQLSEGLSLFRTVHGEYLTGLLKLLNQFSTMEDKLAIAIGIQQGNWYEKSHQWIPSALDALEKWEINLDKLKDWYQWLLIRNKLREEGLGFIAGIYQDENLPSDEVVDIFNKSFYSACIQYIFSQEPELELFKGKLFNDVIQKYKLLAAAFEKLTKEELYARLASGIPSFTREATQNSEVGILQKNIRNNARGISIRKLFDQIPNLLNRMCPCMLMSPISVAQYINPDTEKFDLIIFDEASQMPTYEAVGAIARGKQVVIVGDPKQMPPTSFFTTSHTDDDHIEMEDLESILDDCLALSMPSHYLLWHYRSKHESLIAFSNSEYYDNKLLTFPSPDNIESKVRLVPVKGIYDKGKTRQNRAEAEAIVAEIERRLSDKKLRKRSIGVVTFSSSQQALIEDMLSDLFIFRPDLESRAVEGKEPLFIKNLENVQGDERDVILFSVGYGPDAAGKVSMNFGPLNRPGGERRLNVAVSRARYEMIVYSTLRSDRIDLNRTSAAGVGGLKRFLEYAERGERMVRNKQTIFNTGPAIENIIAQKLQERGYTVHTHIGYSGYKIDIGVVDKENSARYILGILCDGENYRQTKTARDREIVQNTVLRLLGWSIIRIWTLDWWENPEEVLAFLEEEIQKAEENKDGEALSSFPEEQEKDIEEKLIPEENNAGSKPNKQKEEEKYILTRLVSPYNAGSETFFHPENKKEICTQIIQVIATEAPISRNLLCKRILSAWNISRTGQRLDAYLEALFTELNYYRSIHEGMVFFWNSQEQYQHYSGYRINSRREPQELPPEEIANAIRIMLEEEISLPVKDLIRVIAQRFGFARSGNNVEAAINRGILEAERRGFVKTENEKVIII